MRNEKELDRRDDEVNARYVENARSRTTSNGHRMQRVFDASEVAKSDTVTLWERIKRSFPTTEELDVAGRQVSGFVVPHWAAGVLLATILGCVGFLYNQISGQRDILIEMKTELRLAKEHDLEYRSEFKNQLNVQKVYIDNLTNQLTTVRGLLTQNQLRTLERNSQAKDN